jgi:hypothetical protein
MASGDVDINGDKSPDGGRRTAESLIRHDSSATLSPVGE